MPNVEPNDDMDGLHRIPGVEIFSAGKWNGDQYTTADLDEMVRAFEANKDHIRPFLKLGHSDEQKLLEAEGMPAAGWIENVYRKGEKLMADFCDIPNKIYELIRKKAYRKVSCEIYMNCQIGEEKYPFVVGAVALLGAEMPGVMNLDDILAHYRLLFASSKKLYASQQQAATIKSYSFKTEEVQTNQGDHTMSKTERELELESKLATVEAEKKATEEKLGALESENKKFAAEKLESTEKLFQLEIEKNVDAFLSEKLITPAMKPYVAALLGKESANYAVAEKSLSKNELVKDLLVLFQAAAKVNLEESSTDSYGTETDSTTDADKIAAEVKQYAIDNKVPYGHAYKVVAKKYEAQFTPKPLVEEE